MDTLIEILIDNSNSMGPLEADKTNNITYVLPDGTTRMELAKRFLVTEIIPKLGYASSIVIKKFHSIGHTSDTNTSKLKTEVVYEGKFDEFAIISKINAIQIPVKSGGTPLTAALSETIEILTKKPNADRQIILVTDGEETDMGNGIGYIKTAENAIAELGIQCTIHTIGISQSKEAEEASKVLATSTGGAYVNLKSVVYNNIDLQELLRPIHSKVLATSIQKFSSAKSSTDAPTLTEQTSNTITSKSQSPNNEDENNYDKLFEQTKTAFSLISKQIENLAETINQLKKSENVDEEIEISESAELNERVRLASESYLYNKLKEKFNSRIKWMNEVAESGASYDFEVLDTLDNSTEYYIECKATMYTDKVFFMTKSGWHFFLQNKSKYQLFLITSALTNPSMTKIENFMEWLVEGKVVPYSDKNVKLKAERILFTIVE